jgi:hypothetical protein
MSSHAGVFAAACQKLQRAPLPSAQGFYCLTLQPEACIVLQALLMAGAPAVNPGAFLSELPKIVVGGIGSSALRNIAACLDDADLRRCIGALGKAATKVLPSQQSLPTLRDVSRGATPILIENARLRQAAAAPAEAGDTSLSGTKNTPRQAVYEVRLDHAIPRSSHSSPTLESILLVSSTSSLTPRFFVAFLCRYQVLKQVHPDTMINPRAHCFMLEALMEVVDQLTVKCMHASAIRLHAQAAATPQTAAVDAANTADAQGSPTDKTIIVADVIQAVRGVLPGELVKHAVSEGTKMLQGYEKLLEELHPKPSDGPAEEEPAPREIPAGFDMAPFEIKVKVAANSYSAPSVAIVRVCPSDTVKQLRETLVKLSDKDFTPPVSSWSRSSLNTAIQKGELRVNDGDKPFEEDATVYACGIAAGPAKENRYTATVTEIYMKHNPEKLKDPDFISNTLEKYAGKEELLLTALKKKYMIDGPAPMVPSWEGGTTVQIKMAASWEHHTQKIAKVGINCLFNHLDCAAHMAGLIGSTATDIHDPLEVSRSTATNNTAAADTVRTTVPTDTVHTGAAIFVAAVLEYLCAEVLELAGNAASDDRSKVIQPRHISLAIMNDEELNKVHLHMYPPRLPSTMHMHHAPSLHRLAHTPSHAPAHIPSHAPFSCALVCASFVRCSPTLPPSPTEESYQTYNAQYFPTGMESRTSPCSRCKSACGAAVACRCLLRKSTGW